MTRFLLAECVEEALAIFSGIAEEKGADVRTKMDTSYVVSDKRALGFMLSQIYANAFKYTKNNGGIVETAGWKDEEGVHLVVSDNGSGAREEDLPFLFDKGFTGNRQDRQNATGMGLYFVKKYAEVLGVEVRLKERVLNRGFGIELLFPVI